MVVSSHHFLVTPLITCGALLVVLLICRWVFSTSDRDRRADRRASTALPDRGGDYGLLVPIASVRTADDAQMLQAVLRDAGIRCTLAADADGAELLVFQADVLRARDLVSSR